MSLRGNLVDFPVVEVLQLLAVQEKTGVLRLYGEKKRIALVFEKGVIISTWDRALTSADPLKEYILEVGILPEHLVHKALRLEARADFPFLEILLREGMITLDETARLVRDQVKEVVGELLSWKKGRFDFAPDNDVVRYGPDCAVKVESILLEAVQKMDETIALGPKIVFPGIPKNIGPVDLGQPITLSVKSSTLHMIMLALIPLVALALSHLYLPRAAHLAPPLLGTRVAEYSAEREIRNVRIVLEMYRVIHDRYPSHLNQLVSEELLSIERVTELMNHKIRYRSLEKGNRYFLFSEGYTPLVRAVLPDSIPPSLMWDMPGTYGAR